MEGQKPSTSRRTFLRTTAVTGVLVTTGVADVVAREGETIPLTHGVASGDVRDASATLWTRAAESGYLHFELATKEDFSNANKARPVEVLDNSDYTGQILVEGLSANTRYYYRAWAQTTREPGTSSKRLSEDEYESGTFVTAPAPEESAPVTLAWTGDAYGFGDDPVDPPFESLASISELSPDFFLFLGDTIYSDAQTPAGKVTEGMTPEEALPIYRAKYREMRDPAERIADKTHLQSLLNATSVYAMWDDHEVINNFAGSVNEKMPTGRRAFAEYWPLNRDPTSADDGRLYGSFRWGKHAELFVIDTRQYRDPNETDSNKTLLGAEQLSWFKGALKASDATFKLVASPPPLGYSSDSWYSRTPGMGYEEELHDLLGFIDEEEIRNVVVLAGDVHQPYVASYDIDGDGESEIYEAVSGPVGAPGNPAADRFYSQLNPTTFWSPADGWETTDGETNFLNYGVVRVGECGDELTVEIHDETGTAQYEKTITASDTADESKQNPDEPGASEADRSSDSDELTRFATTARGAAISGLYATPMGKLLLNVPDPSPKNQASVEWATQRYNRGAVGSVVGIDVTDLPATFEGVPASPDGIVAEQVNTAFGSHQVLANGGDTKIGDGATVDDNGLGIAATPDGRPLTDGDSPNLDGFVPTAGKQSAGYLFTGWRSAPGAISRMRVAYETDHEPQWRVETGQNLDVRERINGTWRNAGGTVTPWNTPLTSEALAFPDTSRWNDPDYEGVTDVERLADFLGADGDYTDAATYPNPYRNGHVVEIENPTTTDPTPERRFAMGRFSHEDVVVMPDERTIYLSDTGTGAVFFKFVADEAGDPSSGTLYAAKLHQQSDSADAEAGFDVEWIELASASDTEIEVWVADYDDVSQAEYEAGRTSYISDEEIEQWARGQNPYDDQRIPFLESRKAAAAVGATAEWHGMGSLNVCPGVSPGDFLYLSVSAIEAGMDDDEGDIRLTENPYGGLFRMRLDENFDVKRLDVAKAGDQETLRNPVDLLVLKDGRVLVGEDSDRENDVVWMYSPAT